MDIIPIMCWKCGKKIEINRIISRTDVCPSCGADVRCCKNCRFYKPGSHYDCYEAVDELVKDKENANFCTWFMLAPQTSAEASSASSSGAAAFNALFGEKTDDKPASSGKDAFNALFGD